MFDIELYNGRQLNYFYTLLFMHKNKAELTYETHKQLRILV